MKHTRKILFSVILFALALLLCTGCGETSDTAAETETDAPETESELRAEDIVYPDESLPVVHISTADNFQTTSKDEYVSCNIRLELNDRYGVYTNTYTDSDGGDAKIRCRGNASYTNPEMREKNKYSYKVKLSEKANVLGMGKKLLCSWISPGKNTGMGCHSLLQGIFPTQGSKPGLQHCRQILYH